LRSPSVRTEYRKVDGGILQGQLGGGRIGVFIAIGGVFDLIAAILRWFEARPPGQPRLAHYKRSPEIRGGLAALCLRDRRNAHSAKHYRESCPGDR
jgi:hypothetical protein